MFQGRLTRMLEKAPSICRLSFGVVFLVLELAGIYGGPDEVRLIDTLLKTYNQYERPAAKDNAALTVEFMVTLQQIIDVNEKNQMINTNLWLTMQWTDYKLAWDPAEYGNVTEIRLPESVLWKPDILLYNSVDPAFMGSYPTNMVVYSSGVVMQLPPGIFTSACTINIQWFPFDDQSCHLKFGSWTYDGTKIDLQMLAGATEGSTDGYTRSGEWDLLGVPGKRNVVVYECCPDNPYIDLTFNINIRRRKLYYLVNIVVPCLMLAALTLLLFTLPVDAGEKIGFGVTILLSLTVFLLLVAEALPATSDAVPLIALYFAAVMMMNACSVVFTVLVLNWHHRSADTNVMSPWVKRSICEWLAWLLRIQRPGYNLTIRAIRAGGDAVKDIEMSDQPNSKSLLSNVTSDEGDYSPCLPRSPNMNGTDFTNHKLKIDARSMTSEFSPARHELRAIIKELRFITDRLKSEDEDDQISLDWKFAAHVIDRLLLWIFTVVTIVSALGILLAAPNIFSGS